jgi:hypothetical protein
MTKKIEDGGPAFPEKRISHLIAGANGEAVAAFENVGGMSLRDYFAGKALQGAWSDGQNEAVKVENGQTLDEAIYAHWFGVARCAYIAADAMIEARKSGGEA